MKTTSYRLAEYRIIESGTGMLWWETHAGIGAVVGGKCFVGGEILFIGPRESEEPGFLANEFLNQIDRFPKWERTKFYCLNYEICYCQSGRKLTEKEIAAWSKSQIQWTEGTGLSGTSLGKRDHEGASASTEDVSYRLGRYEIIQKPSGQVWWKAPSGHAGLRVGKSIIAGDILFIGAVETEESGNLRRQFLDRLDQLPEWRTTQYYAVAYALYDCGTGKSHSEGEGGRSPNTDSVLTSDGVTRKNVKGQESASFAFSKLRTVLRAMHPHAETRVVLRKDRIAEEKKKPKEGVKNKSSLEANANKSNLPKWDIAIQWLGRQKWIGYIVVLLLTIAFLTMALLVDHWKKEDRHHKRDGHSNTHRSDH